MNFRLIAAALVVLSALAARSVAAGTAPTRLSHGRFKDLVVYAPASKPTSFVLFLSGDEGWNKDAEAMALELVQQGAMVAGIDTREFKAVLESDGGQCAVPAGDLENLSHFVQAYFHGETYLAPLLAGISSGGTLAYAVLAQAPKDTFAGALTVGFCPRLNLEKPLCKGSGLEFSDRPGAGTEFKPIRSLNNPWVSIHGALDRTCPIGVVRDFISKVHGASLAVVPDPHMAPFSAAFAKLNAASSSKRTAAPPAELGDLPVVVVPAQPGAPPSDFFALIMSGDGGWAGLDQEIAASLSAKGIPVVGLDSLRYYWTARTPDGLAADTDRLIRYYLSHFGKNRVLLIGYSQGADVLPFAVNRLPPATKSRVALAAILGMSKHALFEFHVSNWISDDNSGPLTLPEVNSISGTPVLCIYGEQELDSLCPKLEPTRFRIVKLKGGHHFDGNYAQLAEEILAAAKP
jgi:type IV secretory pathway VirJ component